MHPWGSPPGYCRSSCFPFPLLSDPLPSNFSALPRGLFLIGLSSPAPTCQRSFPPYFKGLHCANPHSHCHRAQILAFVFATSFQGAPPFLDTLTTGSPYGLRLHELLGARSPLTLRLNLLGGLAHILCTPWPQGIRLIHPVFTLRALPHCAKRGHSLS